MQLDTAEQVITWKYLGGKQSSYFELPSEHIAIDVLEFPPTGWQNRHDTQGPKIVSDNLPVLSDPAPHEHFEGDPLAIFRSRKSQ
eukprot:6900332-Karenia_brevis.AAC.1